MNGRKVRCFVTFAGNDFVNDDDETEEYNEYDEDAYDEDEDEDAYDEDDDKDELNVANAKRTKRKKRTKHTANAAVSAKEPRTTKSNKSTLPAKRKELIVPADAVLPTQIAAVTKALLAEKNTPTLCKELTEMLHSTKAVVSYCCNDTLSSSGLIRILFPIYSCLPDLGRARKEW